jgi:hypothetical protein
MRTLGTLKKSGRPHEMCVTWRKVIMPLSDREQKMFAEIERQLVAEDPRFVARSRRRLSAWSPEFRLRVAIGLGVVGVLLVFGLTFDLVFGILGMALLLSAIVLGAGAASDRAKQARRGGPATRR